MRNTRVVMIQNRERLEASRTLNSTKTNTKPGSSTPVNRSRLKNSGNTNRNYRISVNNMSAACRKQMLSFDYLKKIYIFHMHILFCTAAKHLFGISMCTRFSLNITNVVYTAYLTLSPEIMVLIR